MNKNKLTIEDMLRTLKITQSDPPLIKEKLVQAFKRLPYVFQNDADKIADHILKDKLTITVNDLMNYLGSKNNPFLIYYNFFIYILILYLVDNTWNIKNKEVKPDNSVVFNDNLTMLDTNWLVI